MERVIIVEKQPKSIGIEKEAIATALLSNEDYMNKLGRPGAVGALEDAKMVDEGALTSIQYYNKLQEEVEEEEKWLQ